MSRWIELMIGVAILAGCWVGPAAAMMHASFAVHMTVHMAVVAVASGFLALAVAETRADPVRRWPGLFSPLSATVVEWIVVWAWHAPALHHFARGSGLGLVLEQGSFLLSGLYLWLAVLGGDRDRRASRAAAGVVGLLLTAMHMTLLGALLGLASRPLYAHSGRALGLSALEDQQLGGAIMLTVGAISYLAGAVIVTLTLLRPARIPHDQEPR